MKFITTTLLILFTLTASAQSLQNPVYTESQIEYLLGVENVESDFGTTENPVFSRTSQSLDWQIVDKTFAIGDTVKAEFRGFDFDSLTAYQMCMLFDTGALKFVAVTFPPGNPMQLSLGCFSWFGKPGYGLVKPREIRHVRSMPYSKTYPDNTHGFSVVFVAKQAGVLSAKFTLSLSGIYPPIPPLSYRWPLIEQPLTVAYVLPAEETVKADAPESGISFSAYPNPTSETLNIETLEPARVMIYSATGQTTHDFEADGLMVVEGIMQGINFVRIRTAKAEKTVKVVKY